jgi:hypothetical protein
MKGNQAQYHSDKIKKLSRKIKYKKKIALNSALSELICKNTKRMALCV